MQCCLQSSITVEDAHQTKTHRLGWLKCAVLAGGWHNYSGALGESHEGVKLDDCMV